MKNKIIILVVFVVFILIGLVFAQMFIFKCRLPIFKSILKCPFSGQTNQGQTEQPESVVNQPPVKTVTLPKVLYNLAGSIQEIAKDSIVFEAAVPYLDNNNEAAIKNEVRKALITATTKFSRLSFVEKPGSKSRVPQEASISLNDLKKGDYVEVVSNQDISQAPTFEATLIRMLQKSF